MLTFVAQVLKFGAVVILVEDKNVELADAYEGVRRLVRGCHCYCILSLPLPINVIAVTITPEKVPLLQLSSAHR